MPYTLEDIQKAVRLAPFDGRLAQQKMSPRYLGGKLRIPEQSPNAKLGGVLALFYALNSELHLVFIRRRDDMRSHAGQISFPGGRHEAPETLEMTALRETHEEVGVDPQHVQILGALTPLYILPSNFEVYPFVGWHTPSERPSFLADPDEVAEILEIPLTQILDPQTIGEEIRRIQGYDVTTPYYRLNGHNVWGATAMMLSEMVARLQTITSAV